MEENEQLQNIIPQLEECLCHDVDWLVGKVLELLPEMDLSPIWQITDGREKVSVILQELRRSHDAVWRKLINCICMECSLPMDLEVQLLSLMGEASEMSWKGSFSNEDGKNRRIQESASRYRKQIRNSILEKYQFKNTGDPRGQCNPMFVEPLIKKVKIPKYKKKGKADQALEAEAYDTENITNLFKRTSLRKTHAILLIGMPGTGKTMMAHRICYQWAQGEFSQYTLTFLFEFRQLNLISKHCTLRELLFNLFLMPDLYLEEAYEFVIRNPQKVLIIFDGLDEFADWPLNFQPPADQITSISNLFTSIVNGTVLQGCTIIVTCRSKLLSSLPLNCMSRVAEVLGFTKDRVEQYVDNFFGEIALKDKVLLYLRDNHKLMHMCFVPALCYIVCVCLEHLLKTSFIESNLPQTITQFYVKMLRIFIENRQASSMDEVTGLKTLSPLIFDLARLAHEGLDNNKTFFYSGEISEELKNFATAHRLLTAFEVKKFDGTSDVGYSFVHLSSQEFFAALYLIVSRTITTNSLHKRLQLKSKWNLKFGKKDELTDNVHIFISGLSSKGCQPFLLQLSEQSEHLIQKKQETIVKSLEKLSNTQLTGPNLIELCHCVYETQDLTLARNSGKNLAGKYSITNFRITPVDMTALVYVVKCGSCLVPFDFAGCPMEQECLEVLGTCDFVESLSFRNKKYGDAFARALSSVITDMKHLKKIRLTTGRMTTCTIKTLKESFCRCTSLQEINLQGSHLKLDNMLLLLELFEWMKQLKLLDLSNNELNVTGVLTLLISAITQDNVKDIQIVGDIPIVILSTENAASLSSPQVKKARNETTGQKEKSLSLINCSLACEDVTQLIAIIRNQHLSDLNLSGNPFGDDGLKKLTDSLPELHITGEMNLSKTLLSEEGVLHLVSCMQSCLHVKQLFASLNQTAVLYFFNDDDDDQRNIRINGFRYHQQEFKKLCGILQQCSKLTHLDLSDNNLGNAGISQLTKILPYLERLHSVNLSNNNISLGGILSMTEALSVVEKLTDVNISFGNHQKAMLLFQDRNREESSLDDNKYSSTPPLHQLKSFSLTEYRMTYPKLQRILPVLVQCPNLTLLNLSSNALSYKMIANLLKNLPQLPNLTLLNISKSDLSTRCVLLLADSINHCARVKEVDVRSADHIYLHFQQQHRADKVICRLNSCRIGNNDVAALLKVVQKNPYLTEVSMCMNYLSEDGILVLLAALSTGTSVSEITACLHPTETVHIIFLPRGGSLKTIRLTGCSFQVEHVKKLCCILQRSTTVSSLKLKRNNIPPCVLKDVLQAVSQMPHDFTLRIEEPWLEGEHLISLILPTIQHSAHIKAISVQQNKMTMEVEGWKDYQHCSTVSRFQGLNSLRFNHCEAGMKMVSCLWPNIMAQASCLTELDLSNNDLGDVGVQAVSDIMASLPCLLTINLSHVNMSYIGVTSLTESLMHCKSVNNIVLSHNEIGEKGALSITELLTKRKNLKSINASACFLGTTNAGRRFIAELSKCLELEETHLMSMDLDDASLLTLSQGLAHMSSMRILMLGKNKITHVGVGHLADSLKHCPELEVFDFSCNSVEDACTEQLARMLPNLKKIRKINLSQSNITTLEGLTLIEALGQCQFMEEINLSENLLEATAAFRLADVLPQLCHLKSLILKLCHLTDNVCKSLANALKCCQSLEQITLSWNYMSDEGAFALACALKHLGKLKILDLEKNWITDQGAEAIAQALHTCLRIKVVHLWCNRISGETQKKLKKQDPRMNFSFFQEEKKDV